MISVQERKNNKESLSLLDSQSKQDLGASYQSLIDDKQSEEPPNPQPYMSEGRPQTEITFGDLTSSEATFYGTSSLINHRDFNNLPSLS